MATKSMLKSINIKNRSQAKKLVNALEHAQVNRGKKVIMNRSVVEVKKEDLAKLFKDYKG